MHASCLIFKKTFLQKRNLTINLFFFMIANAPLSKENSNMRNILALFSQQSVGICMELVTPWYM